MLKQRVITALLLAACFLSALYFLSPPQFWLFIGVPVCIAAWEWAGLAGFGAKPSRVVYAAVMVLGGMAATYLIIGNFERADGIEVGVGALFGDRARILLLGAGTWWALALLWVQSYPSSAVLWGRTWVLSLMGVLVLAPLWVAVGLLIYLPQGWQWLLLVMGVVAAADSGAYFVGRACGRRKLAPRVSPGKTWEGLLGGQLAALLVVFVFLLVWAPPGVNSGALVGAAIAAALASVLGDLVVSMAKRHRGVKDSSHLLPGHGGLLDRVDGLSAAIPVFALLYSLTQAP